LRFYGLHTEYTELKVTTVPEGGMPPSGEEVRINVQLIDANTDEHRWAEILDRRQTQPLRRFADAGMSCAQSPASGGRCRPSRTASPGNANSLMK